MSAAATTAGAFSPQHLHPPTRSAHPIPQPPRSPSSERESDLDRPAKRKRVECSAPEPRSAPRPPQSSPTSSASGPAFALAPDMPFSAAASSYSSHDAHPSTAQMLPPAVLNTIAYWAADPGDAGSPVAVGRMALVCRRWSEVVGSDECLALVCEAKFDLSAPRRRFGDKARDPMVLGEVLRRRFRGLKLVRRASYLPDIHASGPLPDKQEAAWDLLWLLLENDGINIKQCTHYRLREFLRAVHSQIFLRDAIKPGFPPETTTRSILIWVSWLAFSSVDFADETEADVEEAMFVLRPYVFAAHKFEAFFAPFNIRTLPIREPPPPSPSSTADPFVADLTPRSRGEKRWIWGEMRNVVHPPLCLAAFAHFFRRVDRSPHFLTLNNCDYPNYESHPRAIGSTSHPVPLHPVPAHRRDSNAFEVSKHRSAAFDNEVQRLFACADPYSSPGLPPLSYRGAFEGKWVGRYAYFDFAKYRETLEGDVRALYTGPFGEKAIAWEFHERVARVKDPRPSSRDSASTSGPGTSSRRGSTVLASYQQPRTPRTPASLSKLLNPLEEEPCTSTTSGGGSERSFGSFSSAPDDDDFDGEDDASDLELMLEGGGTSDWGEFNIRGRVRRWDGLVTIVLDYEPDGRGRWLWRGYICPGGLFIGRWRDTFTPENMYGYEGAFIAVREKAG